MLRSGGRILKESYSLGVVVQKHTTIKKAGESAIYRVVMKSGDKKTTLTLEIPELGRSAFAYWPENTVLEMVLKKPSQETIESFLESQDEEEDL